jgi:iron(III) transport system permease protein
VSDAVALHPPATHRIFGRLGDPAIWLFSALIVVLVLLVANPILRLVWDSFHTAQGDWTLQSYVQALGRSRSLQALLNSLYLGAAVTVIALALGVPLALAVSRTNMPGRGFTHLNRLDFAGGPQCWVAKPSDRRTDRR